MTSLNLYHQSPGMRICQIAREVEGHIGGKGRCEVGDIR